MQRNRIIMVVVILVLVIGVVLGVDYLRRRTAASQMSADMPPGSIPIYVDGNFVASFKPEDLDQLPGVSFVDAEEGKTQEGWLLKDVLLLHLDEESLQNETQISVSSSSREKSHTVTWAEATAPEKTILFDLANKGTIKLVSDIPGFDTRDAWVQDVDKIEVTTP